MKLTLITTFLLILISSCTIEKRVYNRGWNIQWRKHHSSSKDHTSIGSKKEKEASIVQDVEMESISEVKLESHESIETGLNDPILSDQADVIPPFSIEIEPQDTTKRKAMTVSPNAEENVQRRNNVKHKRKKGVAFVTIVVAIIFLALSVIIYLSLGSIVDLGAALIALLGMFAFGILGLILLLIGLTVLASALAQR